LRRQETLLLGASCRLIHAPDVCSACDRNETYVSIIPNIHRIGRYSAIFYAKHRIFAQHIDRIRFGLNRTSSYRVFTPFCRSIPNDRLSSCLRKNALIRDCNSNQLSQMRLHVSELNRTFRIAHRTFSNFAAQASLSHNARSDIFLIGGGIKTRPTGLFLALALEGFDFAGRLLPVPIIGTGYRYNCRRCFGYRCGLRFAGAVPVPVASRQTTVFPGIGSPHRQSD